jgi:hypothetical protein
MNEQQDTKKRYKKVDAERKYKNWRKQQKERLQNNFSKCRKTSVITTIMSGHGNIRSYLHRLKIIDSSECPCKQDIQTVDHLKVRKRNTKE